jgi:hypothetical protein
MRATIIIKHSDTALEGVDAIALIASLSNECGNRITNVLEALRAMKEFGEQAALYENDVKFAFRPISGATVVCMRPSRSQFHVYVETGRQNFVTLNQVVVGLLSDALRDKNPKFEISVTEDDGRETGITARTISFATVFEEELEQNRIIAAILALAAAGITVWFFGDKSLPGLVTAATLLLLLLGYTVFYSVITGYRAGSTLNWNFSRNVAL